MEPLPTWLEAAVYAAGVTAYADEVEESARADLTAFEAPSASNDPIH